MDSAPSGLVATKLLEEQQRASFGQIAPQVGIAPSSGKRYRPASVVSNDILVAGALTVGMGPPPVGLMDATNLRMHSITASDAQEAAYASVGDEYKVYILRMISDNQHHRPIFRDKARLVRPESSLVYRLTGTVKALVKLQNIWGLTEQQLSTLLGYSSLDDWLVIVKGSQPLDRSVDRRERVGLLLSIDRLLFGLYRDDAAVQKWLKTINGDLGASPTEYMLRGKLKNLYVVADYIQGLTS